MAEVKHIFKAYGNNQVLADFSAVFPEGKITCVMAPSGKGKTTLLRILLGLEKPDKGQLSGFSKRKKVQYSRRTDFAKISAQGLMWTWYGRERKAEEP